MRETLDSLFKLVIIGLLAWIASMMLGFEDRQTEVIQSELSHYFNNNVFEIHGES